MERYKKMTCAEKIRLVVEHADMTKNTFDKLIALAYWIGRESATKEIIDKHNKISIGQTDRMRESRYHNFASKIIGKTYIYSSDYNQDMTTLFGSEKWGGD